MRPFETLLVFANVLTFFVLAVPQVHAVRWTGYVALIALLLTIAQMLVEGVRWQMVPAYSLTATFVLIWLLGLIIPGGLQVNRLGSVLAIGLGIVVLILSTGLPIVFPVFHFPKPTGPYAIGTVTYHWIDTSRPELFTPDPNDRRELMAQVWYPSRNELSALRAPYIQDAAGVTPAMADVTHLPRFLFTHFKYVTTNAVASAPIADSQSSYPVLIFLSGLDGFRAVNTYQIEALVSHGYIVVGLDQPGAVAMVRFPDGRQLPGWPKDEIHSLIMQSVEPQATVPTLYGTALPDGIIPYFAQDVSFTLDQLMAFNTDDPHHILTGRLDLGDAGTFGISLGGMIAAEACAQDRRLQACLIMDVYIPADAVKTGLQQPSMFITRDADTMRLERQRFGGWTEHDIALTLNTIRTVYENLPGDGYYLQIPHMFHLNFTDFPYWSPITSLIGLTGPINGQRGFDIINAYSVAFFDRHLKSHSATRFDGLTKQYPGAPFEMRRP